MNHTKGEVLLTCNIIQLEQVYEGEHLLAITDLVYSSANLQIRLTGTGKKYAFFI